MPPKKQLGDDEQEITAVEDSQVEVDLRREIFELRRKLNISEERKEQIQREAVQERNIITRQYQERLDHLSAEKDDEIRNLTRSNQIYRDALSGSGNSGNSMKSREIPLPRQVQFDGKGSWESFAKPFKALVESCKWNDEECLFRLQSSLRGEAAEYVFNQTTASVLGSFPRLMDALESRYREGRTSSSYLAELESRKFQSKEKVSEYVSDIKRLVIMGYPTADEVTKETISIRYFIKGLPDPQAALHIGLKEPKTIEEARTILETYNSLRDEVKGSTTTRIREVQPGNSASSTFVTESRLQSFGKKITSSLTKKIDGLAKEISRSRDFRQSKKPGKSSAVDVTCYSCGETGHYARDCPAKDKGKNTDKKGN